MTATALLSGGWEVASLSHLGDRKLQEDAHSIVSSRYSTGNQGFVIALADGMGGHAGGAVASRLVVSHALDAISASEGGIAERLRSGCEAADAAVKQAKDDAGGDLAEMGSTLILCCLQSDGLYWLSVGDSVLLKIDESGLTQLNAEHTRGVQLNELARAGKISHAEAQNDPQRHALTSAVTGFGIQHIDEGYCAGQWPAGATLIIASDGIFSLSEAELFAPLKAQQPLVSVADSYQAALQARSGSGLDNTTIILCAAGA